MNNRYREFLQRQNLNSSNFGNEENADEKMIQMFGHSSDDENASNNPFLKNKLSNVENLPIPIKEGWVKKGFIIFGILFILEAIFLFGLFKLMYFLGGALMAIVSFLLARKVHYKYSNQTNFLFRNFTVTLKGVLNHYRTTSILMEASEKLFFYSIILMVIQHLLLSWFSLTSIFYSIGYYGMLLGMVLNLAKRKTLFISKGLFVYSLLLTLMTIQNAFGKFHYVNYHTDISLLVFWYLVGFFQSLNITEVNIDEIDQETENDDFVEEVEEEDDLV